MIAHVSDRRSLSQSPKERINGLRSRRADSGADILRFVGHLLEGHVVWGHLLLLLEGMADG
jgi:hypothetical protein